METQSKALQQTTLPRLRRLFGDSDKLEGIITAITILSLGWERPADPEGNTNLLYSEALEDLTPEQLSIAFSRAQKELKFWPSPGVLRQLAGVETPDQRSEREAREDLEWMLWFLRRHGVTGHPKRGALIRPEGRGDDGKWHPEEYEMIPAPIPPERILNALEHLGCGDRKAGVALLAQHPMLTKGEEGEDPTVGLKLATIDKLEARWIRAWTRANNL